MQPDHINWRSILHVHPAADFFPLLNEKELKKLAADIKINGLRQSVAGFTNEDGILVLVDGRNRLDALQLLGRVKINNGKISIDGMADDAWFKCDDQAKEDPDGFVVSANIRRRHLTARQRRELAKKLVISDPGKSARQVAQLAGVSPTTAATIKAESVEQGDVSNLDTATEALGSKKPVHKAQAASPRTLAPSKRRFARGSTKGAIIMQVSNAIHLLAENSFDVKAKGLLAACGSETKREQLLGDALVARDWLNNLLDNAEAGSTIPNEEPTS